MYIPHSTTCKAKGIKLMLLQKTKTVLVIHNGNLHKYSLLTLLLPLPEETVFRPDIKPRISTSQRLNKKSNFILTPDTCNVQSLLYTEMYHLHVQLLIIDYCFITLHSVLHGVFFLFYKQKRYRILNTDPKGVNLRGDRGSKNSSFSNTFSVILA